MSQFKKAPAMSLFRKASITAAMIGLIAVSGITATSASADGNVPDTAQMEKAVTAETPTEAGLTPSTAANSAKVVSAASFYGCKGQTLNPHPSLSFASVHGLTTCSTRASMIVSINLSRGRWYGWQHLANGYKSSPSAGKVDGNAKWYCKGTGTYDYRGTSYHRATIGSRTAIAYTANTKRFGC